MLTPTLGGSLLIPGGCGTASVIRLTIARITCYIVVYGLYLLIVKLYIIRVYSRSHSSSSLVIAGTSGGRIVIWSVPWGGANPQLISITAKLPKVQRCPVVSISPSSFLRWHFWQSWVNRWIFIRAYMPSVWDHHE